jgi:hypothetical protein
LLSKLAKTKLSGIKDVEIKPTMTQSLRIPSNKTLLDSETLKKTRKKLGTLIEKAPRYHYAELFPDHDEVLEEITNSQGYRSNSKKNYNLPLLAQQEREIVPQGFLPQETNEQLLLLENLYRINGLTVDEAYERCQDILARSAQYYGELREKPRRLYKRLEFMYSKNPHRVRKIVDKNIDPQDEVIIENIVARSPFSKQREKPLRYFLQQLLNWKKYQDNILMNPEQSSLWEYKYRFYLYNRKRGYYPLPFSMMRKWNHRYHEIVQFLLEIKFLEIAPFSYSASNHICKYYRIQSIFSLPHQKSV